MIWKCRELDLLASRGNLANLEACLSTSAIRMILVTECWAVGFRSIDGLAAHPHPPPEPTVAIAMGANFNVFKGWAGLYLMLWYRMNTYFTPRLHRWPGQAVHLITPDVYMRSGDALVTFRWYLVLTAITRYLDRSEPNVARIWMINTDLCFKLDFFPPPVIAAV